MLVVLSYILNKLWDAGNCRGSWMVRKFTGDGNRFANRIIFRISKVTACGEYAECSMTEVGTLYITTYTLSFLPGVVYEISSRFRKAITHSTSPSLNTFFFLPTFSPNLTQTWNFDANFVMTTLFLQGLYGKDFSTFLTLLDLTAALLKEVEDSKGWLFNAFFSQFCSSFPLPFLSFVFFMSSIVRLQNQSWTFFS